MLPLKLFLLLVLSFAITARNPHNKKQLKGSYDCDYPDNLGIMQFKFKKNRFKWIDYGCCGLQEGIRHPRAVSNSGTYEINNDNNIVLYYDAKEKPFYGTSLYVDTLLVKHDTLIQFRKGIPFYYIKGVQ